MSGRILWKFFGAFAFITFTVVIVLLFVVSLRLQSHVERTLSEKLVSNAYMVRHILEDPWKSGTPGLLEEEAAELAEELGCRITVIDDRGLVLADSVKDAETMASHAGRPEVIQALSEGVGQAVHPSLELGINMKYVAMGVEGQNRNLGVIRLALPLSDVRLELEPIYRLVLVGAGVAMGIAFVLAYFLSRSITAPIVSMRESAELIAQGKFDTKIHIPGGGELAALADSLNRMAEALRRQLDDLRQMDRVRSDFVANVSHELKTPLTLIKGYVETLQTKQVDPERAERFMAIISEHADRLGNIVDDLLSLSELESSPDVLKNGSCDLKQLIEDIVASFEPTVAARGHSLSFAVEGDECVVQGDRIRLEQVFVNLIDNAIKYTPDGGMIRIHIVATADAVSIAIEDNGIGLEKVHQARVFERFYRVDKARSRKLGGTGLGLGIAKHIILVHGGSIDLVSQYGSGTTVRVRLPRTA